MRRKKLINKKLQLSIVFSTIGFSLILTLILLAAIFFHTADSVNSVNKSLAGLESSIATQKDMFEAYLSYAEAITGNDFILNTDEMRRAHLQSMEEIKTAGLSIREIKNRNRLLAAGAVIALLIHSAAFIVFLINITHRIAGPVYVINRLLDDKIAGRETAPRSLRDNDYFIELYEKTGQLNKNIAPGYTE